MVLRGVQGFREDYVEHIVNHRCITGLTQPVPCVSMCPAHVDIPGYIALVHEKRYADAVRLIRKDNPFPSACAFVSSIRAKRAAAAAWSIMQSTSAGSSAMQLNTPALFLHPSAPSRPASASRSSAAVPAVCLRHTLSA